MSGVAALRRDQAFDGWGPPEAKPELSDAVRGMLRERLGETTPTPSVELGAVALPASNPVPEQVVAAAGGAGAVSGSAEDRIRHAAGRSYPDLAILRSGALTEAPDA